MRTAVNNSVRYHQRHPEIHTRYPWYAPNAKLRSKASAKLAVYLAHSINKNIYPPGTAGEEELFLALHTCAYHIARNRQPGVGSASIRRQWLSRWQILREYLVARNLGLTFKMLSRFPSTETDRDDLLGDAMFALARAVDHFNPWRGYRFSTYACNVIARALMRRSKKETRYRRMFPVISEIPLEQADREDAEAELYSERLHHTMDENLGSLTDLESEVIRKRFPMDNRPQSTFRQIGAEIGLSKERIRQIQESALNKLKQALTADPILR